MAVSHVAFIMYPVTDVPRAVAFYEGTLGLTKTDVAAPYWVEFDVAGATFGVGNFEQLGKAGGARALALEVDDLEATKAAIEAKGATVTEPHETPVCWLSEVSDPDGNVIWLHEKKKA